jgi:competence protein ComEC
MKNTLRCLLALFAVGPAFAGKKDKTLDVYWIDSEGGGSTLIVTPNDESLLIDAGFPGTHDAPLIVAAAKAAGLSKIDFLAITHWHIDHFGGAVAVAQEVPFETIYQRAYLPPEDPESRQFAGSGAGFRELPAKRESLAPGVTFPLKPVVGGPKLEIRVLAADKKFVDATPEQMKTKNPLTDTGIVKNLAPTDNDNSAVFLISFGDFRFFDGGDITWDYEAKLVTPYNRVGAVDVYQTDHHGYDWSNNPVLLKSLSPNVVVMNNGARKGGEPGSFAGIKALQNVAAFYQLHKSLNVPAEENTKAEFIANNDAPPGGFGRGGRGRGPGAPGAPGAAGAPATPPPPPPPAPDPNVKLDDGNFIKMSVAPDGKSYTITVPSRNSTQTYQTKAK